MSIKFLSLIALVIVSSPAYVQACSLAPTPESFKQVVAKADVIFYGKPITVGKRYTKEMPSKNVGEITDNYFSASYEVVFDVEKIWKGAQGRTIYLLDNDGPCGQHLRAKLETPMLIFAVFDEEGLKIMPNGSMPFKALSQQQRIDALEKPIWVAPAF